MKRQNVRVILASEYPEARSFLKEILAAEERATIIGEAENAVKALTLAKRLRPDVAIIDSHLPHNIGLDGLPLSRIGGLDASQAICEQLPNVRVVLVSGQEEATLRESTLQADRATFFCRETRTARVPFKIAELPDAAAPDSSLVFARIATADRPVSRQSVISRLSDQAIFVGTLGLIGGWILIISLWLAPPGVFLVGAGVASLLVGMLGKLAAKMLKQK